MRTSEKILLSFITAGIILLGSFIGWKYYENSLPANETSNATANQITTPGWTKEDTLSVKTTPYYNMMLGQPVNRNKNSGISANQNSNYNSSLKSEINEESSTNTNLNTNTNPSDLVSASFQQNSNNNIGSSAPQTNANNAGNEATFSFAIIGDTQEFKTDDANGAFQEAVSNVAKSDASLVMTVGDLVSSCDKNDCAKHLSNWKKVAAPILSKTKMVMGNHDRTGGDSSDEAWQETFDLPTNGPEGYSELVYSFDWGNAHFVVLNSQKPEDHIINNTQRGWLESDLERNFNVNKNIFVFFHEPAYPVSSKKNESLDVNDSERDALWDTLKKYKVTAVFSGHEHIMSRRNIDGIYQFVVGNTDSFDHDSPKPGVAEYAYRGYHYAIVTVKGEEVTVSIYKVDGAPLDSFVIPR